MCSIIAYAGNNTAAPILVKGLKRMEYRGYDSVGIATIAKKKMLVRKAVGKVDEVNKALHLEKMYGCVGIGHTRWATHGDVTDRNAHPHQNCKNDIAIVHNGIVENYNVLRRSLIAKGHKFKSETDSEVIAHLLSEFLAKTRDIKKSMINVAKKLTGAYAFVVILNDGTLAGVRYDEPLIVGVARDGYYIASDVLGFIEHTDKAIFLDNHEIVIIDSNGLVIYDSKGHEIKKRPTQIAWELADVDKGKFAHHTLKEINEQKHTIMRAFSVPRLELQEFVKSLVSSKKVLITGSGSSYNAALLAKQLFSRFCNIQSEAIVASEFHKSLLTKGTTLIAISQSGETADVLRVVKEVKASKVRVLSLVNVTTSSLARASDLYLCLNCGPEIGVAATKSFTAQLAVIYKIVSEFSPNFHVNVDGLEKSVSNVLNNTNNIGKIAERLKQVGNIYVLGRGLHFPIALEAALKLKELVYVHAEGMPAGELKHGPLALIDENTIVIILNPGDDTYDDMLSSIHEIKARRATVIGVSNVYNNTFDELIKIPKTNEALYPILEVIPLQLLAYHMALKRESNPDYPRNLAKSVTVK
ncbi:MAG: glutamine--fructose-6-phosphate transaminase (isomerizing) [Nitrososphaerales archaeon]